MAKETKVPMPSWMKEIGDKWAARIAHVFILHGNIDDLVFPGMTVKQAIMNYLPVMSNRKCQILFDRSKGITFPLESHKSKFLEVAEIPQQPNNTALAALYEVQGGGNSGDAPLPNVPSQAFPLLEKALLKTDDGKPLCGLIIEHAETIVPNADMAAMSPDERTILVTLQRWARETDFINIGAPIFLFTENLTDIHVNLRRASSRIEAIKIPYPNQQDRLQFINLLRGYEDTVENPERLAAQTAGLKRIHIEDILLRSLMEKVKVNDELVRERKEEIIKSEFADILEIIEPKIGFENIGGMTYIKEFFMKNIVMPMKESKPTRVPMGVLMMGPAGTGKTVLAEATSKESGMNCCSLNIGKLLGSFVGQSERNLERALECIKALAPTIVIVDEIDQSGLSRSGGGDSGVSNRIFRRLLEFMSDTSNRGKIVFLGITNRPDLLDAALKRPGRFDKKLPILAPEPDEREAIINVLLNKYKIEADIKSLDNVVEQTNGWTGAELEALVLKAYEIAEDAEEKFNVTHLKTALQKYLPTTQSIREMTELALSECNDLDLLPPKYQVQKKYQKEKEAEKSDERKPLIREA